MAAAMAWTFSFCLAMAAMASSSSAQSCTTATFSRTYQRCSSLRLLGSSLHWTYHPSTAAVDIAFRAPQSSNGWVAWGINPQAPRMAGTQALVAFLNSTTGGVAPYTSPVTADAALLQPADISVSATDLVGEFSGSAFTIYATLRLANDQTRVNHVWQSSAIFSGGFPAGHPTNGDNVLSADTLDFLISGESISGGSPAPSPSGAALQLARRLFVCGCACMLGWMLMYVGM